MSAAFDSEIAAAPCGSRSSARRAPPSRSRPTWPRPSTTRPPTTSSLPLSDTGSHARARTDDARPNTRAGLDRAEGERPAARQFRNPRKGGEAASRPRCPCRRRSRAGPPPIGGGR